MLSLILLWAGRVLLALVCLLVLALATAAVRTLFIRPLRADYTPSPDPARTAAYAEKLSRMVQYETVSSRSDPQVEKFRGFHRVLEQLFPTVFARCEKVEIDGNLLLKWPGKSSEKPILLMSHMDVVEATGKWTHEPFGGKIEDGRVWGRGSGDTKCSLMAFYQAAEELMQAGYQPACDIYLASSCTEEIGGSGAPSLAGWLKEHGVRLFMLCDEGGGMVQRPIPGVDGRFAMIGVFEKGYGDLRFVARSAGGHSSMPSKGTPIPRLAAFETRVEKHDPFRVKFSPEVRAMFRRLAPYTAFPVRMVMANLWLFGPVLKRLLPRLSPQAAAMLKTTIAFTMQQGSAGTNVLPQEAWVIANLRYIPHQSTDESNELIRRLAARYGLETEVLYRGYPSGSLDLTGEPFAITERTIGKCFAGVGIVPYVVTGGTDARFYGEVCDSCVRFSPVIYGPEQLKGMHGLDENIEANVLPGAVDYYKEIITAQEQVRR